MTPLCAAQHCPPHRRGGRSGHRQHRRKQHRPRHQYGHTLIELAGVLAIAAIALTLAAPGLQRTIQRQQINTNANALYYAIRFTHAEAMRRNVTVRLAPRDLVNWERGWHVHLDAGRRGHYSSGDQVLLSHPALPAGMTIDGGSIAYNGLGQSIRDTGSKLADAWHIVGAGGERRDIKINFQGRGRVCDPARDRQC